MSGNVGAFLSPKQYVITDLTTFATKLASKGVSRNMQNMANTLNFCSMFDYLFDANNRERIVTNLGDSAALGVKF